MIRKVYKYATGEEIPEGATYLNTVVQTETMHTSSHGRWKESCFLVWHYFMVYEEEK